MRTGILTGPSRISTGKHHRSNRHSGLVDSVIGAYSEDISTVHHWLRERFRDREWSFQFPAEAYEKFPLDRPTAKKPQKWCDRWIVKKHP
jgi:hypothetical protein